MYEHQWSGRLQNHSPTLSLRRGPSLLAGLAAPDNPLGHSGAAQLADCIARDIRGRFAVLLCDCLPPVILRFGDINPISTLELRSIKYRLTRCSGVLFLYQVIGREIVAPVAGLYRRLPILLRIRPIDL
jgi:hypothetical protein